MNDTQDWILWYGVEWLREQVVNVTATLASEKDKNGELHLQLLMTQDHDELFRRFMRDAMNDVRGWLMAYVVPEHQPNEMEREDKIHLHLCFGHNGQGIHNNDCIAHNADNTHKCHPTLVRTLDGYIRRYLVTKIVWLWCRLKSAQYCQLFTEELATLESDIKGVVKRGTSKGVRRKYFYY